MKSKTTKVRRYLAAILTVLMIFQQATTSVIYASSEAAVPTVTEAPAAQTEETPEKQAEETPEEKIPTEGENEGEESATPTEAPAENEAEPEVTVTPAAEPTATEAPAVGATATPVPETTEVPEATPTEVPTAASFTTADGIASVNLTQPISTNAKFVATAQDADSDYFYNNVDAAMGAWVESNGLSVVDATAYDMHFEADGQELAVNQSATVHINFPAPILTQKPETGIQTTYYVLHIKNGTAVPAGTVNGDANGAYSADITTDGFSPFVFVKAASGDAVNVTNSSANLSDFVKSVTLDGNDWNNSTTILPDEDYSIRMLFQESPEGLQFDTSGNLEYELPAELKGTLLSSTKTFSLWIDEHEVTGNTVTLSQDGKKLIVNLNNQDSILTSSPDVYFWVEIKAKFSDTDNNKTINFGAGVEKTVHIDDVHNVVVEKNHSDYNSSKNEITYTVTVKSKGTNQNIVVTDEIKGDVLKFKNIKTITSNKQNNLSQSVTAQTNGFNYTIPSMSNGEEVKIEYTAEVDYSKVPANATVTVDEKKNTVSLKVDGTPGENKTDTYDKEISNKIPVSKELISKIQNGVIEDPSKVEWKVIVNESKRASIAGQKISDSIDDGSKAYMHYSGTGITINISDGTSRIVPWNDPNLSVSKDDSGKNIVGWKYTVPATDKNVSYTITYTTAVDNSSFYDKKELKNNASVENGGSASSTVTVGPGSGNEGADIHKEGKLSDDHKKIEWTVTVDVPKNGILGASIVDTLPFSYPYLDEYDEGTLIVKGLVEGESWDKTISEDKKTLTITFKYGNINGLKGTENPRRLTITYCTKVNQEWVDQNVGWRHEHENNVALTGTNKTASAKVQVINSSLTKSGSKSTIKINEVDYPKFDFTLVYQGNVTDGDVVKDKLGNSLLKLYGEPEIYGGTDIYNQGAKGGTVTSTNEGFIISSYPKDTHGSYFNFYKLTYTLIPKDEEALKTLKANGMSQDYKIHNEASWNGATANTDVAYDYNPLTKAGSFDPSNNTVSFTIKVNESKLQLNSGESLTLTDTMSQTLRYNASSLRVTADGEDITESVIPDEKNGTLTIKNIPDGKVLEITYDARVIGTGKVHYSNNASMTGCSKSADKSEYVELSASLGGGGSLLRINIHKYEKGNQSSKLQGAIFQLYTEGMVPIKNKNGTIVTCTTDSNGNAELCTDMDTNGWAFVKDKTYYLVEIQAPTDYQIDKTPISFKFVDSPSATNEYVSGDTIYVANTKSDKDKGKLSISKKVTGADAEGKTFKFTVQGTDGKYYSKDGAASDTETVVEVKPEETVTVKDLPVGEYTVSEKTEEAGIDGYGLTVTGTRKVTVAKGETATAIVTNTYTKTKDVSVKVSKVDATNQKELEGAHIQVIDKDDKIVDEWTSGKEPHVVKNLKPGETYTLRETVAPDGYTVTSDTTFTLKEDGTVDQTKTTATVSNKGVVLVEDNMTSVSISKVDITSQKELAGAHIQILDKDGNVVEEWDSTDKAHTIKGLKTGETYTLRETVAPNGYYPKADTTFTLKADGSIDKKNTTTTISKEGILLVEDTAIPTPDVPSGPTAKISKVDVTSQQELEGAKLQVIDKNGNVVDEWISGKTAHVTTELKAGETYTLRETVAPDGYLITSDTTFTLKEDGAVDESKTTTKVKDGVLLVEDTKAVSVNISKVDATNQKELEGAHIQIVDKDGKIVDEWTSGKEPHVVKNLKPGETYTLRETVAPDGYTVTSDTTFTLKEDGTVDQTKTTATVSNKGVVLVEDNMTSVSISKVDITSQKELAGAHIQILDKDGNVVEEWDSTDKAHTIKGLKTGETYTLRETVAPNGYYLKADTTFTLKADGSFDTDNTTTTISSNGVLLVEDTQKTVKTQISKVDADTYEALGGAHLQVIDPDGKVVAEWDSGKDAYTLTDLKPGVVYTLHETAAPKGYKVAEDTTFQLNEDGTIDTANTTTAISEDTLLVKDEKKESKDVSVSVTKKLVTVDGTVIGAEDATYYVALYSDADCTQRVSDVLALNFKNASASTVTFTGLEKGQTYYVGECESDGTCYLANICADGTMYMVDFSDGNAVTVDNADGSTTVYFDNQFENIPDGYYKEAELNITKKLVGSDGKAKNSNEIFYAGIFADEGFTQLSTDVSANIVPLDLAGGSEVTAQVNVALPESGSITLYVTEVDSNGKPVAGAASFKYDVTVDNAQVTLNDDNLSANVVITNTENSTKVTPTPGTPNTPNTPNTTGGFSGKSAVRTGDSTPIGGFIALFAAAAVIAGAAVFFKRRRKDEK